MFFFWVMDSRTARKLQKEMHFLETDVFDIKRASCLWCEKSKISELKGKKKKKSKISLCSTLPPGCCSGMCRRSPSHRSPCPYTSHWRDRPWTPGHRSPTSCWRQLGGRTTSDLALWTTHTLEEVPKEKDQVYMVTILAWPHCTVSFVTINYN